jgi:hypothetical protein
MTLAQLADGVTLKLGYNTQDRKTHIGLVSFLADKVRGSAIPAYVQQYGKSSLNLFCTPFILEVKNDKVRDRKYVELNFSILGMSNNMGIVQVSLTAEDEGSFVGINPGMLSTYSILEAGGGAGRTMYWLEGKRIYFRGIKPYATEVLVKCVPSIFGNLDEDDEIPQPYEFDALLVEGTAQALQEQKFTPEDKANDVISNPINGGGGK